jgi:hypothetical protein
MKPGHVLVLEDGRHRLDALQELLDRLEITLLQHTRLLGGGVRVVGNRIPRAEHDVVEIGEWNEVLDQRRPIVGALAKADRRHLRERSDRLRVAATNAFDAGDKCGCNGAEPGRQNTETASGGFDGRG